jgi:hypothetical protein
MPLVSLDNNATTLVALEVVDAMLPRLVVYENAAGFIWTVLHIEYLRVMLTHLGYPQYFANILDLDRSLLDTILL